MKIPMHVAVAFLIVCAWAGYAAGGLHEQRHTDERITAASVYREHKADALGD
jgi:hypothetical protein